MASRGRVERALAVVGAATLLVVGFDSLTFAATGSSLLLGRVNQSGAVTTVKNTGTGEALKLLTRSTASAPFTTNARGLVAGLYAARAANADKVEGKTLAQVTASLTYANVHQVATSPLAGFGSLYPESVNGGQWGNFPGYGPVGFWKDALGVVNLTGLMCPYLESKGVYSCEDLTLGGSGAPFVTAFTLPVGFRPASRLVFAVAETDRAGRLDVQPDGRVQFEWSEGIDHSYVSLDGVRFIAGS